VIILYNENRIDASQRLHSGGGGGGGHQSISYTPEVETFDEMQLKLLQILFRPSNTSSGDTDLIIRASSEVMTAGISIAFESDESDSESESESMANQFAAT
jgi:hypothetical protein